MLEFRNNCRRLFKKINLWLIHLSYVITYKYFVHCIAIFTFYHCMFCEEGLPTLYVTTLYITTLYVTTFYITTLYVTTLYITTLYVTTLYITTLYVTTLYVTTLYVTILYVL